MVLKGLFDRFGRRKDEATEAAVIGSDGWVELAAGRLVVHDPAEDGRYATITPDPGVRLWINDEEVTGPTAVTVSDRIRYEVAVDPAQFFDLHMAEDEMTVELVMLADPQRLPDTVQVVGRHQVRLQPGYSTRAKARPGNPRQQILDRLESLGVTYGFDETVLDRELANPSGQHAVLAKGQAEQAPVAGQWVWRLDDWSLVEAGQVVAAYQGGRPNLPRITVKGQTTRVYADLAEPQVYLAGNGTRIVPGGRLVASASGRARAVPTPQGLRVHIFPVHRVKGDLTGELTVEADIIVEGSVHSARVTTSGEFLVLGNVERSEIRADVITVKGAVTESRLYTIPAGHFIPLRAEFNWIHTHVEAMREAVRAGRPVTEEAYREVQTFVRALKRKAEQMGVNHPDYVSAMHDLNKVFLGAQAVSGIDLPTAGGLLMVLSKLLKAADQAVGARDLRAGALGHVTAWVGRDVHVQERVTGSSVHCGGAFRTPETATIGQTELVAAGEVKAGLLNSVRGTAPVTIRAGGRIDVAQVQVGCAFEFGAERREFKSELNAVVAGVNSKGQLIIKQKD